MGSLIKWGREKIDDLKEEYQLSIFRKFLIWFVIGIICLLLTLFIEFFIFNGGRFNSNRLNNLKKVKVEYSNFKLTEYNYRFPEGNLSYINYKLPHDYYVYKVKLRFMTTKDQPIDYDVSIPDKFQVADAGLNSQALNETKTIYIDAVIDEFSVRIVNSNTLPVKVALVGIDYKLINNPLRMLCTFSILILIFYTLFALEGIIQFKYEKIAFIYLLFFGTLLVFLVPPRYSWDEYDHFTRSVYTANFNYFVDSDTKTNFPSTMDALKEEGYRSFEDFNDYLKKLSLDENEYRNIETSASSYLFFPYLISAFGIQIAKILKLPIYFYLWFGRLANLAFYIVIVYLAIKIFKPNKKLFFFMALIPNFLFLASGLNISGILNSCLFLFVALIANILLYDRNVTNRLYFLLIGLITLVTICRVTYAPFFLLLWLIPNDNFESDFLYRFNKIITLIITLIVTAIILLYSVYVGGLTTNELEDVDMQAQLQEILLHPIRYITILFNQTFNVILTSTLGTEMVNTQYSGSLYGVLGLICLLMLTFLSFMGNPTELVFNTKSARWTIYSTSLIAYIGTLTVMYLVFTKVGSIEINGFQPRYLLTIFIVLLPALQGENFFFNYNRKAFNALLCFSVILIYSCFLGSLIVHYYG